LFRVLSTAWRRAAGYLAGGIVASARMEQLAVKLHIHADRLTASCNQLAGLPVAVSNRRSHRQTGFWLLLISLLMLPILGHAVPAGTVIDNTATATFNGGTTNTSNTVSTTTILVRTPSTLEFLQYAPGAATAQSVPVTTTDYSSNAATTGPFVPMPAPTPAGSATPIDLSNPVPLEPVSLYHQGDPIFVRITDLDQNLDATTAETVMVTLNVSATGDTEVLRLRETGPNTGVFTGYIQSYVDSITPTAANPGNGQLGLQEDINISASYVDPVDGSDSSANTAMVDPFGLVFDSTTGQPVNGAQVTLINESSGLPAMVYGDDGVSTFPATITSGGSVTDSGGMVYNFAPGEYRFPFVAPGTYRLQVTAPASYTAPSSVPTAILQSLPGAPFVIDAQGSRGLPFDVELGPAIQVDIPIDPGNSGFFLIKDANKQVVSVGDFLQYRLNLTNNSGSIASGSQIVDTLPPGLRYQRGSTTLDGNPVTDPAISADGRTLTFNLNDIADGAIRELRYVVEVAVGTNTGKAINRAIANANAGALISNQATAGVSVKQDFVRDRNILMGRVIADDCQAPDSENVRGLAGVRIYLEDGTYVVTDEQGMYHIEGVKPGDHVVQMDLDSLAPEFEPVICDEHSRFAGRSFSRFVDLQAGTLWRADFHVKALPPPTAKVELALNNRVDDHMATYHLAMHGGDIPLDNMRLMISLPTDTHYIPGSSVLDNRTIDDPEVRGQVLIYSLGKVDGAWNRQLNFLTRVEVKGETAILPSKAFLMFDSPGKKNQRTPMVETVMKRLRHEKYINGEVSPRFKTFSAKLTAQDKAELKRVAEHLRDHKVVRIEATGHSDNAPIRERSTSRFADNFALSVARAHSVGEYLVKLLQLPDSTLVVKGMGASKPYVPNITAQDRYKNRRVELHIVTETMLDASQLTDISSKSSIDIQVEGEWQNQPPLDRKTSSEDVRQLTMPDYDKTWLDAAQPGVQLLWPQEDYNPPIRSIKIAVKHTPSQQLTLWLNGKPVSNLNFDHRIKNSKGTLVVSQWAGVDIEKGSNTLMLEVRDADGTLVKRIQREVRMSSLPVRAELVEDQSRLVADGKQTPVIAVRLFDKDGRPAREGLIGEFSVKPPHVAMQDIDDLQRQPLSGLDRGNPRYRVGKDGVALIELKPTTRTGEAELVLPLRNREVTLRPWLQAAQRDWILVGLAQGTVAHNTVSGNMESLSAADLQKDTYSDGKVAFFAKGSIQGKWLLTLAYDSDKDDKQRNTLFQEIDPDSYFPVYGDETTQGYDAASREKLYVRLERKQFYALFGDYQTGLTVTELARYDRSLTGFKSELRGEHYNLNMFASETTQNFVKDEIRGEGTSGLYHLKYTDIVFNSDKVRIETRDRFRPQIVLSSQPLSRHVDYNIDYDAGTLYFKRPIPSKDASLNPVYIVVDYETRANSAEQWTWGGRGAVKFLDDKVEIGASYINQGRDTGDDTLKGIDATVDFTDSTQLKLEYATSQTAGTGSKDAYLAELRHTSSILEGSVYYREQESGFGLGQQSTIGSGTRIYGAEGRYHLTDKFDFVAEAFRQTNLQTNADRDVVETGIEYDANHYGASAGVRSARDSFSSGSSNSSEQLTLGAHKSFLDNRLNLRINHDQSLSDNANPDYPTRTILGADYLLNPSTTLFVEQEFTFGENQDSRGTRIGMNNRPWTGATLSTSVEQRSSENGQRLFANAGLKQTWQLSDRWSLDASLDSSTTIKEPGDIPFSTSLPPASGNTEDFTAVSLGTTYQNDTWSWTSRLEQRNADSEDKWGIYSAAVGEPRKGLGLSARLQWYETQATSGMKGTHGDLRLGLVHRPFSRRWTFLNRTDFVVDSQSGGSSNFDNWKFVNNLLANYRRKSTQISTYYGAKYNRDTIDSVNYSGYTDSIGIELRHDLGERWDIGARASTLHSWNSDQYDYSYGLSVGFNPATNIWLSAGYNWAGYEDNDFSMAGYAAQGPYLKLRIKFDQQSVRDAASWFNRQ
jgi:uncharacterized repeat protein (TIGR01451 family)